MKMANKSISQILEGQEVLLNSVISSLDLNETSSRTVRPLLEYLRQDIKAHLQDLQEVYSMTQLQEDLKNVQQVQWHRIDQMDKRISKLEPSRSVFNQEPKQ